METPQQSTPAVVDSPLPTPRRFKPVALTFVFAAISLLIVIFAVVLTGPRTLPAPPTPQAKDSKATAPTLLDQPPRAAQPTPDDLLAQATRSLRPPQRPRPNLVGQPPQPLDSAEGATPPGATPLDAAPPPGVYRPYPSPFPFGGERRATVAPAENAPWRDSFNSSLIASRSAPASAGQPLGSALTPPPLQPPPPPAFDAGVVKATTLKPPAVEAPSRPDGPVRPTTLRPRPRTIPAGRILNLILLTSISTQVPGDAVAHLSVDVFDADGQILLPKGTRFIGTYGNRVALGDHRLAIAWTRIELPGGLSYSVPGLPSTSPDGAVGVPGQVNNHTGIVFGRAALLSLISAGAQLGQPRQSRVGATLGTGEVVGGSVAAQLSQAATDYLNRAIDITPTIFISAGQTLAALLPYDLELPAQ